jgi:hypothetical protein
VRYFVGPPEGFGGLDGDFVGFMVGAACKRSVGLFEGCLVGALEGCFEGY